jgi:protein-S-isoprenylcysteine O-methyltransferase Ste14
MKIKGYLRAVINMFFFLILLPLFLNLVGSRFNFPVFRCGICSTLGQFLVLAGIVIIADCSRLFTKIGRGTPAPSAMPEKLVTKGLYQFSRNPMYLGMFSVLLGEFLYLGSLLLFLYLILIIIIFHLDIVRREEPELKGRFGKEYEEYSQKVPRWLLKKSISEVVSSSRIFFIKRQPKKAA